jgi:dynein light chain 1
LKEVLFVGNPMYDEASDREEARLRVLAHLPQLIKIDGQLVKPSEVEAARQFAED